MQRGLDAANISIQKELEPTSALNRFLPGWEFSAGSKATGNSSWPVVFLGDVKFTLGERSFRVELLRANDFVGPIRLIRAQGRQPDGACEEIREL
jgi:hypothetical protein